MREAFVCNKARFARHPQHLHHQRPQSLRNHRRDHQHRRFFILALDQPRLVPFMLYAMRRGYTCLDRRQINNVRPPALASLRLAPPSPCINTMAKPLVVRASDQPNRGSTAFLRGRPVKVCDLSLKQTLTRQDRARAGGSTGVDARASSQCLSTDCKTAKA